MHFNGVKIVKFIIGFFLFTSLSYGDDVNQYIGGQKQDFEEIEAIESGESSFVPGATGDQSPRYQNYGKDNEQSAHIRSSGKKDIDQKVNIGDFGLNPPFMADPNALVFSNRDMFKNIYRKGKWSFGLSYMPDDYDIKDSRGVFAKTYNADKSTRYGGVLVEINRFFYRGFVDMTYGFNGGFGMSRGLGVFSTSQEISEVKFSLWTIPFDFSLGMDIPMGRYLSLSVSGGPSAMGLYQTRSDKESGEANKHKRQISPGYFAMGKLKISLGNIFSSSLVSLFSDYKITNYHFTITARMQNYENFQDEITISGSSIGAGFTFEYL